MSKLNFDIVTAERLVYSDEVDIVIAPGIEGQLAILPNHAPLITALQPGELVTRKGSDEVAMFVAGGFLEVMGNRVTVLADVAERADEIDMERAEAARCRAEDRLKLCGPETDVARAEAALKRSLIRLKIAETRRRKRGSGRVQGL
jgi:F-type H+-transporting ATPase subunit epsilon